ncbi:sugar O-acetyltransferase [Erysipelotrichaceae bacterium HCN-30851]
MIEREKLEKGLWYDANNDKDLLEERLYAEELCFLYNQTNPRDTDRKEELLKKLLPNREANVTVLSPFYADYGYRCYIGEDTFINHNAYLMDGAKISIGSHCFIGPNCGMYTANHPLLASERNRGLEKASPIIIEDDVWIGADVTILPGVRIGKGSVIGAKSVVTKDIPSNVIAAGNPCQILRAITEEDSILP